MKRSQQRRLPQKRATRKAKGGGRKAAKATIPERRTRRHPLFGEIPLLLTIHRDEIGRTVRYWAYDRSYKPPLPPGAVRGNVLAQEFCEMCHVPRYFYIDQEKTCQQCGKAFVFSAAEQKYWYETLKFHFSSVAIRCLACRRRRRTERALQAQLAKSLEMIRQRPDDPAALMAGAEASARLYQRRGTGDLDRALSFARRAARLWPEARELAFWEGLCQALAGRPEKARPLLESFLSRASKSRRLGPLVEEAEELLRRFGEDVQ